MSVDSSGLETGELEQKGRGGGGKGRLYNSYVRDCAQNSRIGLTRSLYSLIEDFTRKPFLLNPNPLIVATLVFAFLRI